MNDADRIKILEQRFDRWLKGGHLDINNKMANPIPQPDPEMRNEYFKSPNSSWRWPLVFAVVVVLASSIAIGLASPQQGALSKQVNKEKCSTPF